MSMPLTSVSIKGYRSVRNIFFPVGALTVFVGGNGTGKTNLYNALQLLRRAGAGEITRAIAEEGGLSSVLWAGPRRRGVPVRVALAAELGELRYAIEVGSPAPAQAAISPSEPLVKAEELTYLGENRRSVIMKRAGPSAWLRDGAGKRHTYEEALLPSQTALSSFRDAARFAALDAVREVLLDWRFYHGFRTDAASPIRKPSLSITTPTLSSDGHDLASVFATVMKVKGDGRDIQTAIEHAFPGAQLSITEEGGLSFEVSFSDMKRPFKAHELSDGTLSYLCLVGALCGYRLPGFIALNEPETSLHPDLLEPLARLIAQASERTQVWVVTHSDQLAGELLSHSGVSPRTVLKRDGETWIAGLKIVGAFADDDAPGTA